MCELRKCKHRDECVRVYRMKSFILIERVLKPTDSNPTLRTCLPRLPLLGTSFPSTILSGMAISVTQLTPCRCMVVLAHVRCGHFCGTEQHTKGGLLELSTVICSITQVGAPFKILLLDGPSPSFKAGGKAGFKRLHDGPDCQPSGSQNYLSGRESKWIEGDS